MPDLDLPEHLLAMEQQQQATTTSTASTAGAGQEETTMQSLIGMFTEFRRLIRQDPSDFTLQVAKKTAGRRGRPSAANGEGRGEHSVRHQALQRAHAPQRPAQGL